MKPVRAVKTFNDKYPFVGPVFWMTSLQYYVVQLVAASAWQKPYSWLYNTISDLGNTACGIYGGRGLVCSPDHALMNISFIFLGFTMICGAALIYHEFQASRSSAVGFNFMALAGLGTIFVGAFPENTISALHTLGAFLPFLIGNIGMIILGLKLELPRWLKIYTLVSGIIALVALVHFVDKDYLGIGIGGIERITAYPQTMWLIVFGMYISKNRFLYRSRRAR